MTSVIASVPVTRHVQCAHPGGLHTMAYHEWRPAAGNAIVPPRTVVCVHGLTRTGRDFDPLAERLVGAGYRVVCPDLAGRGESDRLPRASLYGVEHYLADCVTLLARLDVKAVDWIGTSLGGLIGMSLASLTGSPIDRLVLNDIGPCIDSSGLERIRGYVGDCSVHVDFAAAECALRKTMEAFGPHDDAQFRVLSRHYFKQAPGGGLVAHYDPAIAEALQAGGNGAPPEMWRSWERIRAPMLVLRGGDSDILSPTTLARMTSNAAASVDAVEFEGVGHAPTLIDERQIDQVTSWLRVTLARVAQGRAGRTGVRATVTG